MAIICPQHVQSRDNVDSQNAPFSLIGLTQIAPGELRLILQAPEGQAFYNGRTQRALKKYPVKKDGMGLKSMGIN